MRRRENLDLSFTVGGSTSGDAAHVFSAGGSDFDTHSSFILASGRETLIASGERRKLASAPAGSLMADVSALFAGLDPHDQTRLLVGAIPFKKSEPSRLFQPRSLERFSGER